MNDKIKEMLQRRIEHERKQWVKNKHDAWVSYQNSVKGYTRPNKEEWEAQYQKTFNDYIAVKTPIWQKIYTGIVNAPRAEKIYRPAVPAITTFAKTREKLGNQRIDLNFFNDKRMRKLENFAKGTNIRTLKKLLKNNITEAEAQGAKNWTTRAKNFINNFQGDKNDLLYIFKERYVNKLENYVGDTRHKKQSGSGVSIVRQSARLTKKGTIRKRYKKHDTYHADAIEDINNHRNYNIKNAIWRLLKVDNSLRHFNAAGWGTVSHYFMNSISYFAAIPGAGLHDLREIMFDHEEVIGIQGGELKYYVQLSAIGREVLKAYFTDLELKQPGGRTMYFENDFIDLRKKTKV